MPDVSNCPDCTHYDLVVIGAGPHSLALVARLLERAPSSIVSETEHSRLHTLHSGKSHRSKHNYKTSPLVLENTDLASKKILVIDAYGKWMERWDRSFDAYNISHLRSPLFFHLDPSHPDSLQAYTHKHNRQCELHDITHIVDNGCTKCRKGKKKSKSMIRNFTSRDREQFYTPSTALFSDFCEELIDRYALHDMVVQGICTNVDALPTGKGFQVTYECTQDECHKRTTIYAGAVVAAVGNTNIKSIPDFIKNIECEYPSSRIAHVSDFIDCLGSGNGDHFCPKHANDHPEIIPPALSQKLKDGEKTSLLIVGGGLTSAQMVCVAIKRGFKNITLVMRSQLKIRQFDFSLDLMGRNSGTWFAKFWMESDPRRRLAMIKKERNGGSITPEYAKLLERYVEEGILTIHQKTNVSSCRWLPGKDVWSVEFDNRAVTEYQYDQIWLATGSKYDIHQEPVFKTLASKYDIETAGGLPVLNNDLQLHPDLNFFVMSGYSALVLGPVAANLQGGRVGAERIASRLWDIWTDGAMKDTGSQMRPRGQWSMSDIAANMGNYFSALEEHGVCC